VAPPHGVVGPAAEKCDWLWCCMVKDFLRERESVTLVRNGQRNKRKGAGVKLISRASLNCE
jgi:hypothetical protein